MGVHLSLHVNFSSGASHPLGRHLVGVHASEGPRGVGTERSVGEVGPFPTDLSREPEGRLRDDLPSFCSAGISEERGKSTGKEGICAGGWGLLSGVVEPPLKVM